ncbi:uncharacterized protein DS421_14g476910 [Arachis hypogaea]|nr:uncharacterized protein DS421_14g476910 [Arachis hypogaea]
MVFKVFIRHVIINQKPLASPALNFSSSSSTTQQPRRGTRFRCFRLLIISTSLQNSTSP